MKAPFLALMLLVACGAPHREEAATTDSALLGPDRGLDTAAAYGTAIAEYTKAMSASDGALPDTLYIGKHDEFLDIELPAMIENTHIRIVTPTETEAVKDNEHFAYLNIFAWPTSDNVEFFVVNFRQGMRHWPDGRDDRHLRFAIVGRNGELALDSLWR